MPDESLFPSFLVGDMSQNQTLVAVTKSVGGSDYFTHVQTNRRESESTDASGGVNFNVVFKIFYKTEYGEQLQIVGGCPELGDWKAYKCPMRWTEGHIWVSEPINVRSRSYFMYKYVVMNTVSGKAAKWEKGPNRIADLAILPDKNKVAAMRS